MSDHYETRCPSCGGSDEQGCYADCPTTTITALRNELHIAQEWSARVIAGREQDITEITALRAENERLLAIMNSADALRSAIRKAGVKRHCSELYMSVCAFDSARAALEEKP